MKRLCCSDPLGGLISTSPAATGENNSNNNNSSVHSRGFQSMMEGLEEEDYLEEFNVTEKKRRLSGDQVKTLEKNFEAENRLEPERKIKLARELNLQPRQVAIWFQNRRARWKTKQLEIDYGYLKASYDDLRLRFIGLQQSKELVLLELNELKSKIKENHTVKNEVLISEEHCKVYVNHGEEQKNFEDNNGRASLKSGDVIKDGSSDSSDSSAVLNEDINNSNNYYSPTMAISSSPTSAACFQHQIQSHQQQTFVKMEEHNFCGGEESCDFFSDEQAPSLHWDCQEPWN
ncbi:hypothetical protein MKW94_003295 [Papaver nudicaule]|uniref:Homeobox-leucine zipper protein n=1 Tax=Papaver nudicaule TaxID=74823 RepID=A0AA42B563_PAPNU|nr:hypothetical protein [Papaver nudicaule]